MRPVNLLPPNLRPRETSGKSGGAYALLGVLGLLVLGTVMYVMTANQVTSRQSEAKHLKAEAQAADARAGALTPFGDFRAAKETRLSSVKTLAGGRFDWERMTRELARVVPGDVWLTSLDATATGESAGGSSSGSSSGGSSSSSSGSSSSSSGASGTAQAGPKLSLSGCAPNQQDVAETMVRLRRLNQAQEVKLLSSTRPEEQPGASAGGSSTAAPSGSAGGSASAAGGQGCGSTHKRPNYAFQVSVTLSPTPQPTVAGHRVPGSLGGGA